MKLLTDSDLIQWFSTYNGNVLLSFSSDIFKNSVKSERVPSLWNLWAKIICFN